MATVVEVEENAGNDRVHVTEDKVIDVCDVCVASEPPKHRDMRIMIKEGSSATLDVNDKIDNCNPCTNNCKEPGTPLITRPTRPAHVKTTPLHSNRSTQTSRRMRRDRRKKDEGVATVVVVASVIGAIVGIAIVVSVGVWVLRHRLIKV